MPAQGRKNVHGKTGVRFKAAYTKSKYENMLRNVVTDLIIHEEATKYLEEVINENRNGKNFGNARFVRNIAVDEKTNALDKLFSVIGPKMANRNGGYTRQLKLGNRRGDDAPIVLVTWVE